jgi:GAF domain-containing protein
VEEQTVQFRLNVGLPAETRRENRDESLCSIAILREGTTVYENLPLDPCELAQPGLVQRLNLQFYAGSPLRTAAGFPVGVLCVLDHQPRPFTAEDRALLTQLAGVVMQMLDSRVQLAYQGELNWQTLYDQIETSVMRLSTLAALAKWEDHDQTPGAIAYRQSTREEISRVLNALQDYLVSAV